MKERQCQRCGKRFPLGDLVYVAQVKVFADFDGVLFEPEEGVEEQMQKLLKQVEEADPATLEKEVYQELTLILCKSCRDRLVDEMEHPWMAAFRIPSEDEFIH